MSTSDQSTQTNPTFIGINPPLYSEINYFQMKPQDELLNHPLSSVSSSLLAIREQMLSDDKDVCARLREVVYNKSDPEVLTIDDLFTSQGITVKKSVGHHYFVQGIELMAPFYTSCITSNQELLLSLMLPTGRISPYQNTSAHFTDDLSLPVFYIGLYDLDLRKFCVRFSDLGDVNQSFIFNVTPDATVPQTNQGLCLISLTKDSSHFYGKNLRIAINFSGDNRFYIAPDVLRFSPYRTIRSIYTAFGGLLGIPPIRWPQVLSIQQAGAIVDYLIRCGPEFSVDYKESVRKALNSTLYP